MTFKTLDDLSAKGQRVLVRTDLNVPMKDGVVTDDTRIKAASRTLKELSDKGAKVIVLAHFGRPKGEVVASMSLDPLTGPLTQALGRPVRFAADCCGAPAIDAIAAMQDGDVLLLENTRFHPCEEKNNPPFGKELADLGDAFVNDAFSAAHRAHASTEGITHHLPSYAGRLMEAELTALGKALSHPDHPVVAVVGGAKVSTKLDLLSNLLAKVDHLVIGGGMANTFLAAKGIEVGKSLCEHDLADTARAIMNKAASENCIIHLPVDIVVAREFAANAANETLPVDQCPEDAMILDAGPQTAAEVIETIRAAQTLVWNGPLGAFEITPFDAATVAVAQGAAEATRAGTLLSVAGGGDTVAALNHAGVSGDFTYVSTAGGAFLEWLEGKTLPGVAALEASQTG